MLNEIAEKMCYAMQSKFLSSTLSQKKELSAYTANSFSLSIVLVCEAAEKKSFTALARGTFKTS